MARNENAKPLYAHYVAAKKYRERVWDPRVKQVADYLWGDQQIRRTSRPNQNDFVTNLIYKDFTITISMLSRDVPSVELHPIVTGMEDKSEALSKVINHDMLANDFITRQTEMLSYGLPFGMGFFRWSYDPSMRMGLGGIRMEAPDSRDIFFVPGVAQVRKSLLFFERQRIDKLRAYHDHPKDRAAIDSLFRRGEPFEDIEAAYDEGEGLPVTSDEFGSDYVSRGLRGENDKPYVERVIAWVIDQRTLKDIPELVDMLSRNGYFKTLSSDKEEEMLNKPLYPRGKMCVFSEGHLFYSKQNPFPSFPYAQYVNQYMPAVRPGDEFGMGEYDQLLELQDKYNVRDNQVTDAMDKIAFGGRIMSDGTFDAEEVNNNPVTITQVQRLGSVGVIPQMNIPPEAFRYLDSTFIMGRELQNRSAVAQGDNPSGVRSGEQVETLHELSNRVMVSRTHSLEASIRALVRGQISMIGMYYEPGVHYPDTVDLRGVHPDAFEISIKAGLSLPASQQQRLLWARQLYEMDQTLDREEMLRLTPESYLPNKPEVLARMREKWAAEAEAQRAQQAAEVENQEAQAEAQRAKANPPNLQVVQ